MLTVIAVIAAIVSVLLALKWRISTHAIMMFCIDKFREPTSKEIADYTQKVIGKMFK